MSNYNISQHKDLNFYLRKQRNGALKNRPLYPTELAIPIWTMTEDYRLIVYQ